MSNNFIIQDLSNNNLAYGVKRMFNYCLWVNYTNSTIPTSDMFANIDNTYTEMAIINNISQFQFYFNVPINIVYV